jgi:hypothetical protein
MKVDVIKAILTARPALTRSNLFDWRLLDFESVYRDNKWKVTYFHAIHSDGCYWYFSW